MMRHGQRLRYLAAMALGLCLGAPGPGPRADTSPVVAACRGDFQAFCAGVPPGGMEAVHCLRQAAPKASPDCRASLAALPSEQQLDTVRSACRMDYFADCFGIAPGGKDALQCLNAHAAEVSSGCRTAMVVLP